MSSRSKNFRRRRDDTIADGDDTTTTTAPKPITPKPSANLKKLSFADDDEEEDQLILHRQPSSKPHHNKSSSSSSRKSSLSSSFSHKITTKDRLSTTTTTTTSSSNVQPQAGEYTKEKLLELQKNTRTLASSSSSRPPHSSEPIVLLKGIIKPLETPPKGNDDGLAQLDDDEDEGHGGSRGFDANDAGRRFAAMGIGKERDSYGNLIPDQATINAIRAKRERMRQSRTAAPDYISLDGGSNHGAAEGLSDEEPEFQNRIELVSDEKDSTRRGVFESVEGRGVEMRNGELSVGNDEEEEEDEKWIEEQVRKGLGKRIGDTGMSSSSVVGVNQNVQPQGFAYHALPAYQAVAPSVSVGPTIGGSVGVSRSAETLSISQQAEVATQALQQNIIRLKESHGRTISSMTRTDENLSSSLSNVTALEMSLSAADAKFIFMQELRDFVSVICAFLQDKASYIEEFEERMQGYQDVRASAVIKRRQSDNADEMTEIEAAVGAAMSVFGKGGSGAAAVAAATAAAQAASAATREQTNLSIQLDEFGRDLNKQERMDVMRRAEARKRRRAKSESRRISSVGDENAQHHIEGESSTDESDSECCSYRSARKLLLEVAEDTLSNASEDYSQLSAVKKRFEAWKKQYSSSYRDAYMSLSAPAIFSPYVRLELLKWDPLYEEMDFNKMQWHNLLFDYGLPDNGNDFSPDDADADLVPGLVENIALPILHHQIDHCWDMLSTKMTTNAVSAANLVVTYVPASSDALRKLLDSVRARLANAVTDLKVPTWTPLVIKAVPNAARVAAYRFGMSVRLLRNICLWKDILALSVLEQLALDELLGGKILPHLRSIAAEIHDAMTRTERIVASLSGVWAGPDAIAERSDKLQPFVDYMLTLGKTLEKKHMSGVSENETSGLARRLKKMLVDVNEYDKARAVSQTFHLKEAL